MVIVGVTGGSCSGKTTLVQYLNKAFGEEKCSVIQQDFYFIDQSENFSGDGSVNFDHPSAVEFLLLANHIRQLKGGEVVEVPSYNFITHKRTGETKLIWPRGVVLVDGTLLLAAEELKGLFDDIIFLDTPEDLRFKRRLSRDVQQRGRSEEGVREQFAKHVKPMHDLFIEKNKDCADLIVSGVGPIEDIFQICKKHFHWMEN